MVDEAELQIVKSGVTNRTCNLEEKSEICTLSIRYTGE